MAKLPADYDVLLPTKVTTDGVEGVRFRPDGEPELIKVVKLQDGKSLNPDGEIVEVKQRKDCRLLDMKVLHSGQGATHKGPARVASDSYRNGWDGIFGKQVEGELNC